MLLRKSFFVAAVRISLPMNSGSVMVTAPEAQELANGVIPTLKKPIEANLPKPDVVAVPKRLAENLPPTGVRIVEDYMHQSKAALLDEIGERIDKSRANGAIVHIEDGETDDFWHDILAARDDVIPSCVLLRGGPWIVRKKLTKKVWDASKAQYFPNGPKVPEIFTIHGDKRVDWGTWDGITGKGVFPDEELKKMQEDSEGLEKDPQYLAEVARAESALLKLMKDQKFTTIVVKTAPTGLARLIQQVPEYETRITVVWGAAVAVRDGGGFTPRFNYRRDPEAGDMLLALKCPKILISPAISRTDMIAVVDKAHASIWNKYSQWKLRHPGFDHLRKFTTSQNEIVKLLDGPVAHFMKAKIEKSVTELQEFEEKEEGYLKEIEAISKERDGILTQIKETEMDDAAQHNKLAQLQEQLKTASDKLGELNVDLQTTRTAKKHHVARGMQWKTIFEQEVLDGSYRDVCAVDLFAHIPMVKELREKSIQGVMRVELQRQPQKDKALVTSVPSSTGSVFMCIEADSDLLSRRLQDFIYSVLDEEPEVSSLRKAAENGVGGVKNESNEKLLKHLNTLEIKKPAELQIAGVGNTVQEELTKQMDTPEPEKAHEIKIEPERNAAQKSLRFER